MTPLTMKLIFWGLVLGFSNAIRLFEEHALVREEVGKTVILPCHVKVNPENFQDGKAVWSAHGKTIETGGRFEVLPDKQLKISNLKKIDGGEYFCNLTAGNERASAHSLVRIIGIPDPPANVHVDCESDADDHIAIVTWDINPLDQQANNQISRYGVTYRNENIPSISRSTFRKAYHTPIKYIKLAPGAPYSFQVQAFNEYGRSQPTKAPEACSF